MKAVFISTEGVKISIVTSLGKLYLYVRRCIFQ